MRTSSDLIFNGELILSGNVVDDSHVCWMWEEDVFYAPSMVRQGQVQLGEDRVTVRNNSVGGHVDAGDPDNGAVQVGIQWLNAAKEVISGQPVITRTGLSVSTGRIEVLRIIGAGLPTGDLFLAPPVGAVYCQSWIQFYGVGHRRIGLLLECRGMLMNPKKLYRLYRD